MHVNEDGISDEAAGDDANDESLPACPLVIWWDMH